MFEVTRQGIAYLNHAGMSPLPAPVKQAMVEATEAMALHGSRVYTEILDPVLAELREAVGRLVNCDPNEVAFVESTSMGINIIANSLPLQPGDNVLLCDTEFPSNVYPWQHLESKGIGTHLIPTMDGGLMLEALDHARTPRSRVVAVSAIQFFSGRREDLVALGCYCADHGLWLVVDAMQAAGIVPLDVHSMGIHAMVAGGQKALLGPPGQGFMVIRRELVERMYPVFLGPLSVVGWEHWLHYDRTPRPHAERFMMGTMNIVGLAGLLAAVKLLLALHVECIAEWVTHLSSAAIADLTERGCPVVTPRDARRHAHIVTFRIASDPDAAVHALQANGVILRAHLDTQGNPYLRISSHAYNTVEEVLRVGEVLEGTNL
jgi:selenocysteine lyase/cysteine desulfurase